MEICQNCGKELNDTARFCGKCGKLVEKRFQSQPNVTSIQEAPVCKNCGNQLNEKVKFCRVCGSNTDENVISSITINEEQSEIDVTICDGCDETIEEVQTQQSAQQKKETIEFKTTDMQKWEKTVQEIEAEQKSLSTEELSAFKSLKNLYAAGNFEANESAENIKKIKDALQSHSNNRILKLHITNFIELSEKNFKGKETHVFINQVASSDKDTQSNNQSFPPPFLVPQEKQKNKQPKKEKKNYTWILFLLISVGLGVACTYLYYTKRNFSHWNTHLQDRVLNLENEISNMISVYPPFKIEKVEFGNTKHNLEIINDYGSRLFANQIRFLKPKLYYTGFNSGNSIVVQYKIFNPNGELVYNSSYSSTYTVDGNNITIFQGSNSIFLKGWGNENYSIYSSGTYRCEIWCNDMCIKLVDFILY